MARQILLMSLFVALLACNVEARQWTDATGAFSVEAELVGVVDGVVRLKKTDGRVIDVPIARLSRADQTFVREQSQPVAKPDPPQDDELNGGEAAILAALSKPTKFDFNLTPLSDVIDHLSNLHKIPILVDRRALDSVGLGVDMPVSGKSKAVSLRDDLHELLKSLDLTWLIRNDVLMLMTVQAAHARLSTTVYKILGRLDVDRLIRDITSNIQPESWADFGGAGAISSAGLMLIVVSQTEEVHNQIAQHYGKSIKAISPLTAKPQRRLGKSTPQQALQQETSCNFIETPLTDVAANLSDLHGVDVSLDVRSLNEVGIGGDTPVTFKLQGIRLSSALSLMLEQQELTWSVSTKGILITTWEAKASQLNFVSYPARDLAVGVNLDTLINIIKVHIAPSSWGSVGGPCKLRAGARGTLDVTQTSDGHLQIMQMLALLRSAGR